MNIYWYWPIILLILILFIAPITIQAQSLYITRIGLEDGLSQNTVYSIAQDDKGFMWFGTQSGLNRYDGYKFKIYNVIEDDPNSIGDGDAARLLVDRHGKLWVGGINGLNLFDDRTERFVTYKHDQENPFSLSNNQVWALLEDQAGAIWIGTGHGLNRFDKESETFARFLHEPTNNYSVSHNVINTLFQDRTGNLWIGTDNGLNRFDYSRQRFDRVGGAVSDLSNMVITAIGEDSKGRLWVGTDTQGLFILDKTRQVIMHKLHSSTDPDSISANKIKVILNDRKDRLWIGTDTGGLNLWDESNDQFIRYRHNPGDPHSISENEIISLYEDNAGVIWIGTFTKGISKFNPYGFGSSIHVESPNLDNPDPHTDIRSFLIDKDGALWVSSSTNGIRVTLPNGNMHSYRYESNNNKSISNDRVYCLYEDHRGTVWAGAEDGWLNKFNRKAKSFVRYQILSNREEGVRYGKLLAIDEDNEGQLWIGSERGGALSFDLETEKFTSYHHDPKDSNTISNGRVFDVHVDRYDNVWFATFGGGLSKYDKKSDVFTNFIDSRVNNGPINTGVIHADIQGGVLWLGTYGQGLFQFDMRKDTFINYTKKDGLPDLMIYGILQDKHSFLWISHNQGISKFDVRTSTFYNYDERDGLQSNEFNGGAYYQSADGKFYFGGINGYNAFYPNEIIDNPNKPPIYITDFKLFNKSISGFEKYNGRIILPKPIMELDKLPLSYKDYVFSLEFTGLDYANSTKNQYAYKMEGLEDDWNYVDSKRRFATYTTLPPGDYTFHVIGSNNHGVWNKKGVSLGISISPPFWQTWWFRLVLVVLFIAIIYIVYTLRVRSISERNIMLKEQVKERTHDLEKTLSELVETKNAFEASSQNATGVLHNVGNILNSVNISAGLIRNMLHNSAIDKFVKANTKLRNNFDNIKDYIYQNEKGVQLLKYYLSIEKSIVNEKNGVIENTARLIEKISTMKESIADQQRSAKGKGFTEKLSLEKLIDHTIELSSGSDVWRGVKIEKIYKPVPEIKIEKAKLVQVLLNLYKNAKESMEEAASESKLITIELSKDSINAFIKVSDTGLGIAPENLKNLFNYGYTTKSSGHGFGLHSCINYMEAMGGSISAVSEGLGKGATFVLKLPLDDVIINNNESNNVIIKAVNGL